jgi:hypothetical protein
MIFFVEIWVGLRDIMKFESLSMSHSLAISVTRRVEGPHEVLALLVPQTALNGSQFSWLLCQ